MSVQAEGANEVSTAELDGHKVAIQFIKANCKGLSALERQKFEAEVILLADLRHPNIVQMIGVMSEIDPACLFFELCYGGNLYDLLHGPSAPTITMEQKQKMALDTAMGMEYLHMHRPQILHRDLRSANLLLLKPLTSSCDIPMIKVTDYGLGRIKVRVSSQHKCEEVAGPYWTAPEVLRGCAHQEEADVFSYGMCLYELLSCQLPFMGAEPVRVAQLIAAGVWPELELLPIETSEDVEELLVSCWAAAPSERPPFCTIVETLLGKS